MGLKPRITSAWSNLAESWPYWGVLETASRLSAWISRQRRDSPRYLSKGQWFVSIRDRSRSECKMKSILPALIILGFSIVLCEVATPCSFYEVQGLFCVFSSTASCGPGQTECYCNGPSDPGSGCTTDMLCAAVCPLWRQLRHRRACPNF